MLWGFTVLWAKRSPHRTRSSSELIFIVSLITPSFPTFKPVFGCLCRLLSGLTSWKPLLLSAASVLSYLNSHHMFRSEPLERGLKGVHQPETRAGGTGLTFRNPKIFTSKKVLPDTLIHPQLNKRL